MKKIYLPILLILTSVGVNAQNIPDSGNSITTKGETTTTNFVPAPLDTLDTDDKYTKIVLFSDKTWDYVSIDRPGIDSTCIFDEYWDTTVLHAYKDYSIKNIPEEVDLCLVDSTHGYEAPITGKVRSEYKFRRTREHQGIDIPLNTGDTIKAAYDGVVRYTGTTKQTGGYGNLVVIRHSNGLETYYGHLSKVLVKPEEQVKAGEIIGLGGSTGRSTGPHLHFETRYLGQTFDPSRLIDFETGNLRD